MNTFALTSSPPSSHATEAARDRLLVERVRSGDPSAFAEIVGHYRHWVYAIVRPLIGDHHEAEELTQDAFINAFRGLPRFRGDAAFSSWLYRITINLARNRHWYWWRRRKQDTVSLQAESAPGILVSDTLAAPDNSPPDDAEMTDLLARISSAMERLPARHREILTLRIIEHRSYGEIAARLSISIGTVKSRIARARARLHELAAVDPPTTDRPAARLPITVIDCTVPA